MQIKVNKDFLTEYKNDLWKGFSGKEILALGVAFVFGGGTAIGIHYLTGLYIGTAIYVALPASSPILLFGFKKYQDYLSIPHLLQEMWYTYKTRILTYTSDEMVNYGKKYHMRGELKHGVFYKSKCNIC